VGPKENKEKVFPIKQKTTVITFKVSGGEKNVQRNHEGTFHGPGRFSGWEWASRDGRVLGRKEQPRETNVARSCQYQKCTRLKGRGSGGPEKNKTREREKREMMPKKKGSRSVAKSHRKLATAKRKREGPKVNRILAP